jgi:hypothetical protein
MRRLAGLVLVAAACGSDDGSGVQRRPPADPTDALDSSGGAPGTSSSSSSGETGVPGEGEPCSAAAPCPDATYCVAPDAGGTVVGAGDYACSASCVELDDVSRWCLDDAACCDAAASCERGLCRGPSDTAASTDSSGG